MLNLPKVNFYDSLNTVSLHIERLNLTCYRLSLISICIKYVVHTVNCNVVNTEPSALLQCADSWMSASSTQPGDNHTAIPFW